MKVINRLALLMIACNCIALKLCGADCQFAMIEYSVPTSWTELPDPATPTTTITAVGCLMENETSVLVIRAFVNGKPADMVAVPKGSITKKVTLSTIEPDPNKLPTNLPTVRVKWI